MSNSPKHGKSNCKITCQITCFGQIVKTQQQQQQLNKKQQHKNPCQSRESNSGHLAPQSDALPFDRDKRNVSIEFKLFNSINVMGRKINKGSQFCEPHIFNKVNCNCNICG